MKAISTEKPAVPYRPLYFSGEAAQKISRRLHKHFSESRGELELKIHAKPKLEYRDATRLLEDNIFAYLAYATGALNHMTPQDICKITMCLSTKENEHPFFKNLCSSHLNAAPITPKSEYAKMVVDYDFYAQFLIMAWLMDFKRWEYQDKIAPLPVRQSSLEAAAHITSMQRRIQEKYPDIISRDLVPGVDYEPA